MVYKVTFECDVDGVSSVRRLNGEMYVFSKDVSQARQTSEAIIKDSYSEKFAIISIVPVMVEGLGE